MKFLLPIIIILSVKAFAVTPDAVCVFDHKDYDSPGFSLPRHTGTQTIGRFGCQYICSCKGQAMRVTHILEESHFDLDKKDGTGGPKRAKWFICPYSVKNWKPIMTSGEEALLYGPRLVAYDAEIDYTVRPATEFFNPKSSKDVNSLQIRHWAESQCQ